MGIKIKDKVDTVNERYKNVTMTLVKKETVKRAKLYAVGADDTLFNVIDSAIIFFIDHKQTQKAA